MSTRIAPHAFVLALAAAAAIGAADGTHAQTLNGFDLTGALIPVDEILPGGPPRDGIPAIDRPQFVTAPRASFLADDDTVLGVARDGVAKAYPIRILNWHEVVNDHIGSEPVVITYCPLCGSGVAFHAVAAGRALSFGVSGLLYNSDVLLYDRETQSLWSQIANKAITGALKASTLVPVPVSHTTWADWRARHPATLVLSTDTGHERNYGRDPYAGYDRQQDIYFPVKFRSEGFHPKERVLGVTVGNRHKAYPFVELAKSAGMRTSSAIEDTVGGTGVRVEYDTVHRSARAFDGTGKPIAATTLFWFAWYAFHPETEVFRAR